MNNLIEITETDNEFMIRIPKTQGGIKGWDYTVGQAIKAWVKRAKDEAKRLAA